ASDCGFCRQTTPELMPLVKELGIDLPQFNLREFDSYFKSLKVEYTPTLAYFKDGVEVERMEGGIAAEGTTQGYTLDDFKQFFNKYSGEAAQ
ncbi:thioredoxin family protein, partial [Paenibacillus sp. MCAF20]